MEREAHVKVRVRKKAAVMGKVWEIGTRNLETIEGKESGCLIGGRSGDLGMKGVRDIREILETEG